MRPGGDLIGCRAVLCLLQRMRHHNVLNRRKMASRGESQMKSDDNDFRHYCSLCMESYFAGRTPKLLPCFHTFCLPCLTTLAEKEETPDTGPDEGKDGDDTEEAEEVAAEPGEDETQATDEVSLNEDGDPKEDTSDEEGESTDKLNPAGIGEKMTTSEGSPKKTFLCPTCRTPVAVPSKGLSALQTNFYLPVDVMETAADVTPVPCGMCEEGNQQAHHFCHQCQQHMCRSCRHLHDRVIGARDHRVEPLSRAVAPSHTLGSANANRMCQFHPDQSLCFHCCQCDVTICLHCKLTSHEGHDTQDMAKAAIQAKGELTGLHARADEQLQLLEACISRLERDELDLKRQKNEEVQQVSTRYDLLVSWAARARDEFLEEVSATEQARLSQMRMKKASASFFRGNVARKKEQSSQSLGLGADLVLVKNELYGALLKDEALEDHRRLGERREHLTFFRSAAEASVLELATVRAFMGQLGVDGSDGLDQLPSLSFPELVSAVVRMEAGLQGVEADLQDIKVKTPTTKVGFHATMSVNYSLVANQMIPFDSILCNEGDGYSNSTGVFTAPVDGSYMFTTTVRNATNGTGGYVGLMVKGVDWGRTSPPESCTTHCVVSLKEGEQVSVQTYVNFVCMGNVTLFSGVLVSV